MWWCVLLGKIVANKKQKITERKTNQKEITKSTHSVFELKIVHVLLFQFLRWHEFIFRENMILKCGVLLHLRTSHLSAFQSFCACTDLKLPTGRLKASAALLSNSKLSWNLVGSGFVLLTTGKYSKGRTTEEHNGHVVWRQFYTMCSIVSRCCCFDVGGLLTNE